MKWIACMILTVALFACTQQVSRMLPGKIYSLQDGTALDFQIETSNGSGSMTACNPITGETFTGRYAASYVGGGSTVGILNGGIDGTVVMASPPTSANAQGILRGSSGTVIGLYLTIKPGDKPTGHGEGQDNAGNRYQVYF
jgi:hypothetical protein